MQLKNLKLLHRGKIRDVYELPNMNWLMVTTDRLPVQGVVFPDEIPGRGLVLNQMSNLFRRRLAHEVPNHIIDDQFAWEHGANEKEKEWLKLRSVEVKRLVPLKVEAIARGFLSGSAWTQYQDTGMVNGVALPSGLQLSQILPRPIYTPSTSNKTHKENITYEETVSRGLLTNGTANVVKYYTMKLYGDGAKYTSSRGLLCAKSKFEFGVDVETRSKVYLMGEVFTTDSSEFWSVGDYSLGSNPPSFDKQVVTEYLDSIGWDLKSPAPELPDEIVERVSERYFETLKIMVKP